MTFKPLNREDVFDGQTESTHEYFIELNAVRSAVEGLKDVRYYVAEDGKLCRSCNEERFTFAVPNMNWRPNSQVCAWCWINKWFPVFSQSHLDVDASQPELGERLSESSASEHARVEAMMAQNASATRKSACENSALGGSEQTSTYIELDKLFSEIWHGISDSKQLKFRKQAERISELIYSLSQAPETEPTEGISALASVKHGVPAGEFKTESTSANGKDNSPKHVAQTGCICKHGSGAITKQFVEQNGLCDCECHNKKKQACKRCCHLNHVVYYDCGCECHEEEGTR